MGGAIRAGNNNDHCQRRRGAGGVNWADVSFCRGWHHKKSEGLSVESKAYRPHTHTQRPVLAIEPTISRHGARAGSGRDRRGHRHAQHHSNRGRLDAESGADRLWAEVHSSLFLAPPMPEPSGLASDLGWTGHGRGLPQRYLRFQVAAQPA